MAFNFPQKNNALNPATPTPAPAQQPAAPAQPAPTPAGGSANFGSIFSGIGQAKVTADANYIRPGQYLCRINRCKMDRNRKQLMFSAIEMTVVKVIDNDEGRGHRVNEDITSYVDQKSDYFLPDIKKSIASIAGVDVESVGEEEAAMVYSDEQPFAGLCVEIKAQSVRTKSGGVFTKVKFNGQIPPKEIMQQVEDYAKFWPGGVLEAAAHG